MSTLCDRLSKWWIDALRPLGAATAEELRPFWIPLAPGVIESLYVARSIDMLVFSINYRGGPFKVWLGIW